MTRCGQLSRFAEHPRGRIATVSGFYDVVVVGGGAMGSAAAYHLASRKAKVLVLERFRTPHASGSSHGQTRLIRRAYFEHPSYVPLLNAAYRQWSELATNTRKAFFEKCGLALFGRPFDVVLAGAMSSATRHGIALEEWDVRTARARYPSFRIPDDHVCLFEPDAGYLLVDDAIKSMICAAQEHGAQFKWFEPALSWKADSAGVTVKTAKGQYKAAKLVLAAGPWMPSLLDLPKLSLKVRRVPLFWFGASHDLSKQAGCSAFAFATDQGFFYGFPALDAAGIKVGLHKGMEQVDDPLAIGREMTADDLAPVAAFLKRYLPSVAPNPSAYSICMYTMTDDEHFILDFHPRHANVVVASPCSGHGFKFAIIVGDICADLALKGQTDHQIRFLGLDRFAQG